jgi:hypothetical protein
MKNEPHLEQRFNRGRLGFWAQLGEISPLVRRVDILVFALILGFGALQFIQAERASDFPGDDVFFADAARSLIEHGFYGINGYAETNMPPGLSGILALLCIAGGCTHVVFLRTLPVFGTLGFLASYQLLRRQVPRVVAAAICLLLISSPIHFALVTRWLSPCYPYFFTTMTALLVARKLEEAMHVTSRIAWGALLAVLIAVSLMLASAAMALLGAIVASICVIFFRNPSLALARLKIYFVVLLLGMVVQALWIHHPIEASAGISAQEWPVPGFPHSYLSQLKVKSGNYPELGMATARDIPIRILKNANEQSNLLSRILLHRPVYVAWISIMSIGALILIILGWCYSVWPTGGGLQEWYFAGYEFIYLLWPWELEWRFFLPIAPFACLYLWHGGKALVSLAKNKPRVLGAVWLPIAICLTLRAWFWVHGSGIASDLSHAGIQDKISFVVWLLTAILAAWMIKFDTVWLTSAAALWRWYPMPIALQKRSGRILQLSGIIVMLGLIVAGWSMQVKIGRANVDLNSDTNRLSPDADAALWIRSHTDTNAVIMARQVPVVYHYSKRKVVWFPPSSNSQLLMEGIRRNKIDFVIVVRRQNSYYLPPDDDCFDPLLAGYPDNFSLIYHSPEFRIFQVVRNTTAELKM